jgi:myo-inositol catabolism protein IolC
MAPSQPPPLYRLQCVVHRESASGIIIHDERIPAATEAAAVADAKARFAHLLGGRAGSAALRDETGQVVWSARQVALPEAGRPAAAGP